MEILNIFYNDILKEAMDGKVDCYFTFNIRFFNNLEPHNNDDMVPILNITNKELFNKLLIEYVNKRLTNPREIKESLIFIALFMSSTSILSRRTSLCLLFKWSSLLVIYD